MTEAGVGTNRYAYSGNDPVNLFDPGGNNAIGEWLGRVFVGASRAALAGITADVTTPDPTDAAPQKWFVYGVVGSAAAATVYMMGSSEDEGAKGAGIGHNNPPEDPQNEPPQDPNKLAKTIALSVATGLTLRDLGYVTANGDLVAYERYLASQEQQALLLGGGGQVIAGSGHETALRDAPRLAEQYGGQPSDWAKIRSGSFTGRDGWKFETHAYRNLRTGQTVEIKTKIIGH